MKKIIVAIAAAALLLFSPFVNSFTPYQLSNGEVVYVFTAEEMEVLDKAVGKLMEENKAMKARLVKFEKSCT